MQLTKKQKDKISYYSAYLLIFLAIFLILGFPVVKNVIQQYQDDKSTITNREYTEFKEWENKQDMKEKENSSIGD